jgi:1-acyl-sn-glycerol-3-phosphate acyltransferase
MVKICKLMLGCFGWKALRYEHLHDIPQYVLIAAPHTSNWDFPLGILVRCACQLNKVRFLAKSSLFIFPFSLLFKAMGGFPVDRSKASKQVDNYIEVFKKNPDFAIVIAPEGTRKKVNSFKTGFYFIAKGAGIPIVMTRFDYSTKTVDFSEPFLPGDKPEQDIAFIENYFRGIKGKNPALSF